MGRYLLSAVLTLGYRSARLLLEGEVEEGYPMLESDLLDVYRLDGTLVRKMQIDIAVRNTPLDAVGGMGGGDVKVVVGSGGEEFDGRIQDLTEEEWKQLRRTPLMVRLRDGRMLRFTVEDSSGEITRCRIIEPKSPAADGAACDDPDP